MKANLTPQTFKQLLPKHTGKYLIKFKDNISFQKCFVQVKFSTMCNSHVTSCYVTVQKSASWLAQSHQAQGQLHCHKTMNSVGIQVYLNCTFLKKIKSSKQIFIVME